MFQTDIKPFKIAKLLPDERVLSFNCGDSDLNDFITTQAGIFSRALLATSYLCVDPQNAGDVYAYCSLANDKIALTDFSDKTEFNRFRKHQGFPQAKRLRSYPAVKICRLGVDLSAKGCRVGTRVLNYIKSMFVINNKTGCRFITVDAYLDAIPFYRKNGFEFLSDADVDNPYTRLMFFDLMDIT